MKETNLQIKIRAKNKMDKGLENIMDNIASQEPICRKVWDIDKEPTHLPKDHYYKRDIGIFQVILVWAETDKAYRGRIKKEIEK